MLVVGFTGTQHGMSSFQKESAREVLVALRPTRLHHGDCVGADEEMDAIARELGVRVTIHPPTDPGRRAFCVRAGDVVREPRPYLVRNQDIVDDVTVLIAAPRADAEELRSGTWATVRAARRAGKRVVILRRLGGFEEEAR